MIYHLEEYAQRMSEFDLKLNIAILVSFAVFLVGLYFILRKKQNV